MSQPSKTTRTPRRAPLIVLALAALTGGAVSPWGDDAITHAVRFRTALSDFAHPPASPVQLLIAGVPPLA
jgi:hypothetical protein